MKTHVDIVEGARLVTGRTIHFVSRDLSGLEREFQVVTVQKDEEGLFFVNSSGKERRFRKNPDPYSHGSLIMPHEVVWTRPVPEASDEELRRLALATVGVYMTGRGKPWLLHVQSVHDGIAHALPVLPVENERNLSSLHPSPETDPDYRVGNAAIWAHLVRIARSEEDHALHPGSLVVAWMGPAHIADGLPIHNVQHMMKIMTCSVERLGAWLPGTLSCGGYYTGPFLDIREIEMEEERAFLRIQPNEALILGYLDGDTRGGMLLGTTGITFHNADDVLASMFGMDDPELGLWVAENAKWSGQDEDCEIQSDLRPATMADLARFGWTEQGVRDEIAGSFTCPVHLVAQDICEQLILQAAEVAAIEAWEECIRKPWREISTAMDLSTGSKGGQLDHRIRYRLQDFASMARTAMISADGMEVDVSPAQATLRWSGGRITVTDDGSIRTVTPEQDSFHPADTKVDRKDIFTPFLEWLARRPENTERTRPDDPRTVVLVRDDN